MIVKANGTNQEGLSRLIIESDTPIDSASIIALGSPDQESFYFRKPDGTYHLTIIWREESAPRLVSYLAYPWHAGAIAASCILPGFYTVRIPPIPRPRSEWEAVKA